MTYENIPLIRTKNDLMVNLSLDLFYARKLFCSVCVCEVCWYIAAQLSGAPRDASEILGPVSSLRRHEVSVLLCSGLDPTLKFGGLNA